MAEKVKIKKKIIHIRDLLLAWNTPETRLRPGSVSSRWLSRSFCPDEWHNPPPRPRVSVSVSFFSFDWTHRKEPERVFLPG